MLPWSRRMFPGTNLQDLNLDWILRKIAALRGGTTGQYLYKKSDNDFDFGWKTGGGGGGGGTSDYLDLENKPSINNVELTGNKTAADLGLAAASDIPAVPVQSVNGQTGDVNLTAADVGAGTYSKPSGGIPKSDLASAVRTSLGKADSALQSVPSTYRTAAAQDAIDAAQDDDIEALAGSLATIETSPATAAHAVDDYIVYNEQLYKVTAAIAAGQTLTVGTNISIVNVGAELTTIQALQRGALSFSEAFPDNGESQVLKCGKTVQLILGTENLSASPNNWVVIGTLPAGYRPITYSVFMGYDYINKIPVLFSLMSNGTIRVMVSQSTTNVKLNIIFLAV